VINWLTDPDMLPAATPKARIFTYDWDANYFKDAPVQTLLGHADTLLSHVSDRSKVSLSGKMTTPPVIFIASCFGRLILAEVADRAAPH
jgi:hypothetical protein